MSTAVTFSAGAADQPIKDAKPEVNSQNGVDPEALKVIQQSRKSRSSLAYNTYITAETKDIKVEIDLYNTQFFNDFRYMLVPVRIVNKSGQELSLDPAKDRIYLTFRRQTGYESYQLELKNFNGKILPGNDIQFAGKYSFKNFDERLGVEISLKFLKMIVEGLNSGKGKLSRNEITGMEKQMQYNSKGRFESDTLGFKLQLEYKIVKK
jgi:hypothetical protein